MTSEPEEHEGTVAIGDILTVDGPAGLAPPTVKFVHYPGAQQLILWLPKPGKRHPNPALRPVPAR